MKILPGSKFLTLDVSESHTDFAGRICSKPSAEYWVLKQTNANRPKWYVVPAIRLSGDAIKILDEEEQKKRLRQYLRNLLRNLPETQTIVDTGGKLTLGQKRQTQKSGYLLALKGTKPIRIVLPEKTELHPEQQKAEINLTKLSNNLFTKSRVKAKPARPIQKQASMTGERGGGLVPAASAAPAPGPPPPPVSAASSPPAQPRAQPPVGGEPPKHPGKTPIVASGQLYP